MTRPLRIPRLLPRSIKARLMITLLLTVPVIWVLAGNAAYRDARREIAKLFDAQLSQTAGVLLAQIVHEVEASGFNYVQRDFELLLHRQDEQAGGSNHEYEQELAVQIFDAQGNLLLRSANAPPRAISPPVPGFTDAEFNQVRWRVVTRSDAASGLSVQVAEPIDERKALRRSILRETLTPLALALPLIALLIWFDVGQALSPLAQLTRAVARRSPDNLRPVNPRKAPREVRPLLVAINRLLERLQSTLEHERNFTANAAHELRTPLAGLRTQAQVASRAANPEQRQQALRLMIESIDRIARLIDQLLTLARLQPTTHDRRQPLDLTRVIDEVVSQQQVQAATRGISLRVVAQPVAIAGDATELAILLGNLVGNAIKYIGQGHRIEVRAQREDDTVILRVADDGPGVAAEEREHILQRFYRADDTGSTHGSGLGLSIVVQIARLHGADLVLGEGLYGHGLSVMLRFPAAAAKPASPTATEQAPSDQKPVTGG